MFKKLVSNLPFNPSLIGQVAFYAKRLHGEAAFRRSGLLILALAVALQVFAVVSPPQHSLARSNNDLIVGGFTAQSEAVSYCNQNARGYQAILTYYGISCQDVASATTVTLKSTDYNKRLYSMGHLAYGKAGETPVSVPGVGTVYLRYLWSWDTHGATTYKALKGTAHGQTFFILYDCGNVTFIGLPTPPTRCTWNPSLLASDTNCFEPCPIAGKGNIPKSSPQCVAPCPYNKSLPSNSPKCFEPCPVKGKSGLPKTSPECFVPCKYNSSISENNPACKPCEASQTSEDMTACLEYHKTAANLTQKISSANGTTAKPGDTIEYTLATTNKGKGTIKAYNVTENISDVLDYADVVTLNGGAKDADNIVTWPGKDIGSGQTVTQRFSVKIKDPLPNTPTSASDPGHFDNTMTNVYGDTVSIKLPPSIVKTTEIAATTLPNTGPGASLFVAFGVTFVAAYFFARSKLMAKELDIMRADFASTGGN